MVRSKEVIDKREIVIKQNKVPLVLSQDFVSITCKKCENEYLIFAVLRSKAEGEAIYPQAVWNYCPHCGIRNTSPRMSLKY